MINRLDPQPNLRAFFKMLCSQGCQQEVMIRAADFVEVPVTGAGGGTVERGIRCPKCSHFYRAAFDNDNLKAQRTQIQSARGKLREILAARYTKEFDTFQKVMQRTTGPHSVESPIH